MAASSDFLPAEEDPDTRGSSLQGGSPKLQTENLRTEKQVFFFKYVKPKHEAKEEAYMSLSDSLKNNTKYENYSKFMVKTPIQLSNRTSTYKLVDTDI